MLKANQCYSDVPHYQENANDTHKFNQSTQQVQNFCSSGCDSLCNSFRLLIWKWRHRIGQPRFTRCNACWDR